MANWSSAPSRAGPLACAFPWEGESAVRRRNGNSPFWSRTWKHFPASRSELVIPLLADGRLIGVLDLDSPDLNRFDQDDLAGCEALAEVIVRHLG